MISILFSGETLAKTLTFFLTKLSLPPTLDNNHFRLQRFMLDYMLLFANGYGLVRADDARFECGLDCSVDVVPGNHLHVDAYLHLQSFNHCGCIWFEEVDEAD